MTVSPAPPFHPPEGSGGKNEKLMALFKLIVREQPKMEHKAFTPPAAELVHALLKKHPKERIALAAINGTAFYRGFDFDAFHARRMPPPFVPTHDPKLPAPR